MCTLGYAIGYMFHARYSQITCHHSPCIGKNIWIMDGDVSSSQLQLEAARELLYHFDSPPYDFHKRYFGARTRIIVDPEQLIPSSFAAYHKRGAMVGTQYPFLQHIEGNARRRTVGHHADDWTFFRGRSQKTACDRKERHKPSAATGEGTEIRQMIKLKFSHEHAGEIAIPRRDISFVSLVMEDGALGTTMLGH